MKFLVDEMLPASTCAALERLGHDATSARDVGLAGMEDEVVFDHAVRQGRIIVTENVGDYATLLGEWLARGATCVPVVFVRKADLPRGGALPSRLAKRLDEWARTNAEPYIGPHWL